MAKKRKAQSPVLTDDPELSRAFHKEMQERASALFLLVEELRREGTGYDLPTKLGTAYATLARQQARPPKQPAEAKKAIEALRQVVLSHEKTDKRIVAKGWALADAASHWLASLPPSR
jgi:hypothetical protein